MILLDSLKKNKSLAVPGLVVIALLWLYIMYRAFGFGITQDEAHSYLMVKTLNWKQALSTTNTHWINSFFIRLFLWLPGPDTIWKLRLFPVLSWPLYGLCALALATRLKSSWLRVLFLSVLLLNPYVLFYFSVARGYAPSLAFLLLSFVYLEKNLEKEQFLPRNWIAVFLPAALATFSNFSAIYFFAGLVFAYFLLLLKKGMGKELLKKRALKLVFLITGTLVAATGLLLIIQFTDTIFFPGNGHLTDSLLGSLLKKTVSDPAEHQAYLKWGTPYLMREVVEGPYHIGGLLLFTLLLGAGVVAFFNIRKGNKADAGSMALLISFCIFLFNTLLHLLFKTPYLFERATLVLIPSLTIGILWPFDQIKTRSIPGRAMRRISTLLITLSIVFNFGRSFSLYYFREWPVQTHSREAVDFLEEAGARKVGISFWQYSVFKNYYSVSQPGKYHFEYEVLGDEIMGNAASNHLLNETENDFLLLDPPFQLPDTLQGWKLVKKFTASGTLILQRTGK